MSSTIPKHSNMVAKNKEKSRKKQDLALRTISSMIEENVPVSVSLLVTRTGLSRSFFYSNETVAAAITNARSFQDGKNLILRRNNILMKAIEKENMILKDAIKVLKKTISDQEEEISTLKKALSAERERRISLL